MLLEIFCLADNFVKHFEKKFKKAVVGRRGKLTKAEYITLAICKHTWGYRNNKMFYEFVKNHLSRDFQNLPSYQQFNEGLNSTLPLVMLLVKVICEINKNKKTKSYFVDSTPLPVCSFAHRYNVKIDMGKGGCGKNLNGWFFGFKLHMIVNHDMEIISLKITSGSESDLSALDENMVKDIFGLLFGDKGYIGKQKSIELSKLGVYLVTNPRRNMLKNKPSKGIQNFIKNNRKRIETVFGQIKINFGAINRFARSAIGFFSSVFSAILAFSLKKNCAFNALADLFQTIAIS